MDGSVLGAWRIDTLPARNAQNEYVGLWLWHMRLIDTNHIILGGDAFGPIRSLLEVRGDSIIYRVATNVSSLALADEGFYYCMHGGHVWHHLDGKETSYRTNTIGEAAWSIYRRKDGTYFVGMTRIVGIHRFDGSRFTADTVMARLNGVDKMFYIKDFAEHAGNSYAVARYLIRYGAEIQGYLLKEVSPRRWDYIDSCRFAWYEEFDAPHFGTNKLFSTGDGVLFSIGDGGAFRMRADESWESLVRMNHGTGIGGTSSRDMYFGSNNGHFYYYDGSTVKEIDIPTLSPNTVVADIAVVGRKIFVLTHNYKTDTSYLLRGER